jgi:ubiquitin carboxyl-terminal hydrolase L3
MDSDPRTQSILLDTGFCPDCQLISALERAKRLEGATFFEETHTNLAQSGQSAIPTDLDDVPEHFITFIEAKNDKG